MRFALLFLAILVTFSGWSLDTLKLKIQSKRLFELMEKYHYSPRDVENDSFGKDVNAILLEQIDPNNCLFLKEEVEEILTKSATIGTDFPKGKSRYIQFLSAKYLASIQRAIEVVQDIEEIDLSQKTITSESSPLTIDESRAKWIEIIQLGVGEELQVLDAAPNKDSLIQIRKDVSEGVISNLERLSKRIDDEISNWYLNAICLSYDPHSNFFTQEINTAFQEELSSEQSIFGISYRENQDGKIEITSVYPGSSAWYAEEIEDGVILEKIESEDQSLELKENALEKLRIFFKENNPQEITLTILKDGEEKTVVLEKTSVYSDSDVIKSAILEGEQKVGYISLPDFYTNWTDSTNFGCANDIAKSIIKMKRKGVEGLILDLRNNGGGSIVEAIELVGLFINYGPVVISEYQNEDNFAYKDFNRGAVYTDPLLVLVNEKSASASEIVAGALQDYNRATIVGQRTFGKATGQIILPLDPEINFEGEFFQTENPDWGYVKLTEIGLYLPRKTSIQGKGVRPDIYFPESKHSSREADELHFIKLDSIEKKLYFTPLEKNNFSTAKEFSNLQKLNGLQDSLVNEWLDRREMFNWDKIQSKTDKIEEIQNEIENLKEGIKFNFEANSTQFDPIILQLSPFLQTYNDNFLERLQGDLELNEAFGILQKIINQ